MLAVKKIDIKKLLKLWSKSLEVYAPQDEEGQVMLLPFDGDKLTLDYINFPFPVKEYIFKQKEKLFSWKLNGKDILVDNFSNSNIRKRLFFGIRACDAYGIAYMDKFFLEGYKDEVYERNRETAYFVAVNCTEVGENCFCKSMGIGPFASSGYDILFTEINDIYIVEIGSSKGEELIKLGAEVFFNADENYDDKKAELLDKVNKKFKLKLTEKNIHKILEENFNDSLWEEISKDCVRCTGCTNMCPTCTCFNVVEENIDGCSGCRVRYWDSCQSDSFTRNAGEHNPRNKVSRVRYRIYDKMKYIEEKFSMKGCTGCGRCINVCPANINIVGIINTLAEKSSIEIPSEKIEDDKHLLPHDDNCESVYTPQVAVITNIIQETKNIKRFIMQYEDKSLHENFKFTGQFFEITVFGVGEIAISIPFSPSSKEYFDFCIKKTGKVTNAIHEMKIGDKVGLRGPFGKGFDYDLFKGKDVIIIGSGVGLAPVRTMILRILENRKDFGKVVIIGSAMSYEDLIYKEDLVSWSNIDGVKVLYALSNATNKVEAHVGYINDLLPDLGLNWSNTSSIICASPRRIKAVAKDLINLGMKGTDIYTSLETHMRCGIGKCGHCKVGSKYMCIDGPVFNYEEMLTLPPEF
ncbi:4Fe-4S dicluster domain-containing protein [Candidatus Clostridium stratigraminis]|uniref:4Fe-4S dicluster domain-containing protein n=1 Tax=Candidatus Clostridium stratigraminis TaxID=3381661 RepID=A0ABW8T2P5_9CLOT